MEKQPSNNINEEQWNDTASTLAPSILSTTSTITATYPEASYTTKNLPPSSSFHTLIATNSHFVNIILSSASTPDDPTFYITNSQWSPSKPSVSISRSSKAGPVLGVLKLGWGSENTYGLGDPNKEIGNGGDISWQRLKRTSKWTHGTYEFTFHGRDFVWQRTRQPIFGDQPDMECREDGGGDVLAVYIGSGMGWGKTRGRFYLRQAGVGSHDAEKESEDWWGDWEVACLLTGCGVIEGARRRARQRRSGGGGG